MRKLISSRCKEIREKYVMGKQKEREKRVDREKGGIDRQASCKWGGKDYEMKRGKERKRERERERERERGERRERERERERESGGI